VQVAQLSTLVPALILIRSDSTNAFKISSASYSKKMAVSLILSLIVDTEARSKALVMAIQDTHIQ